MIDEILEIDFMENLQKLKENIEDYISLVIVKNSLFFTHFFFDLKNKNIYQEEKIIIDKAFKNFNQLRLLFDDNWLMKIPDSILKECYKA